MSQKHNNVIPFPLEKCRVPDVKKPMPVVQTYRKGQKVNHAKFGVGVVVTCEGTGEKESATVHFRTGDVRQLVLAYAKLEKL